mmetsp:Transcript_10134/g.24329  ORF Transcript_10134/g.24329 Transcript_10134/m.24329 type:complete len:112 (+) Transcript_10134:1160-1495(+)
MQPGSRFGTMTWSRPCVWPPAVYVTHGSWSCSFALVLELVGAQPGPCARDSSWDSVPRTRSFNLPVLTRDPAAIERKRNAIIQLLVAYVVKPATEVTESEEFEHGSNTNLA